MEDFMGFILDGNMEIIPVLMVIGLAIKSNPRISNNVIPIAMIVLGILFCVGSGWNTLSGVPEVFKAVFQGVLVGGTAVGIHQTATKTFKNIE